MVGSLDAKFYDFLISHRIDLMNVVSSSVADVHRQKSKCVKSMRIFAEFKMIFG